MGRSPLVACAVLASLSLEPSLARAEAPARAAAPQKKLDLARLKQALETGSEAERLAALAELGGATGPAAAEASKLVSELCVRGGSFRVILAALGAQTSLAQPAATPSVVPYVRHRQAELRLAAARALAKTGGPEAVTALRGALRGSDARLRREAARSLGALSARDAVPDLFAVIGKEVPEAAAAVGVLCAPADCQRLVELLGKLPFDTMQTGLEPILLRPETEVPENLKLELLERLRRLKTSEATVFLKTVRARYPKTGSARVRAGLDAAVEGRPVVKPKP